MGRHHLVRVGALGQIGRFTSVDLLTFPRSTRVIVRTARGLELGEVLAAPAEADEPAPGDGSLLRAVTVGDELLAAQLEKNRQAALAACESRLAASGSIAVLMDVEHLFDGRTLVFYFLGEVPAEAEALTAELAESYESEVQFRKFADAVTEGCGPGWGTEDAAGCKTCAVGCAVASACSAHKH